jgi:hypothetical protein
LESWLFLGLGIIGLAGSIVGALPSIGFVEAFKSLRRGKVTLEAFTKVVGTATAIGAGALGVGRLALNIDDPGSEDSKTLLYVGAVLGVLSFLGAGGATFLSWRASRGIKATSSFQPSAPKLELLQQDEIERLKQIVAYQKALLIPQRKLSQSAQDIRRNSI